MFMTNSEIANCTFEPLVGSKNPNSLYRPADGANYSAEPDLDSFNEKLG